MTIDVRLAGRTTDDVVGSSMPDTRVACVVVAFHRPESLRILLDGLKNPRLEMLVVNVESDVAVRSVATQAGVLVVDVDGNRGYAAAVNVGARAATTDVVVFMNDDAVISGVDVARLADVIAGGDADVAVPRVVDAMGFVEPTIFAVPTPRTLAREWMLLPDVPVARLAGRIAIEKWRSPEQAEQVDAASAVVVATHRALLLADPLPEDYFLYWEESEWFWRLKQRGAVVQYRPEATAVHVGGRGDIRPEKSRLMARNAVRCVRRTQGRVAAVAALFVVVGWNVRLVGIDAWRAMVGRGKSSLRRRLAARWAGLAAACASWRELR